MPPSQRRAARRRVKRAAVGGPVVGRHVRRVVDVPQGRSQIVGERVWGVTADQRDVSGAERDRVAPARTRQPRAPLEDDLHADGADGGEAQTPRGVQQRPSHLRLAGPHRRHGIADQIEAVVRRLDIYRGV